MTDATHTTEPLKPSDILTATDVDGRQCTGTFGILQMRTGWRWDLLNRRSLDVLYKILMLRGMPPRKTLGTLPEVTQRITELAEIKDEGVAVLLKRGGRPIVLDQDRLLLFSRTWRETHFEKRMYSALLSTRPGDEVILIGVRFGLDQGVQHGDITGVYEIVTLT